MHLFGFLIVYKKKNNNNELKIKEKLSVKRIFFIIMQNHSYN